MRSCWRSRVGSMAPKWRRYGNSRSAVRIQFAIVRAPSWRSCTVADESTSASMRSSPLPLLLPTLEMVLGYGRHVTDAALRPLEVETIDISLQHRKYLRECEK